MVDESPKKYHGQKRISIMKSNPCCRVSRRETWTDVVSGVYRPFRPRKVFRASRCRWWWHLPRQYVPQWSPSSQTGRWTRQWRTHIPFVFPRCLPFRQMFWRKAPSTTQVRKDISKTLLAFMVPPRWRCGQSVEPTAGGNFAMAKVNLWRLYDAWQKKIWVMTSNTVKTGWLIGISNTPLPDDEPSNCQWQRHKYLRKTSQND